MGACISRRNTDRNDDSEERDTITDSVTNRDRQEISISYRIEKLIGQGAFGSVYVASLLESEENIAIKLVQLQKTVNRREVDYGYEARISLSLEIPNLVTYLYVKFTDNGDNTVEMKLFMEYLPENMRSYLKRFWKRKEYLPTILIKLYCFQLFTALAYLHDRKVTHRDIKPQNILINSETCIVKICDLGCSKCLDLDDEHSSDIGTHGFRAPELIFGSTNYTNSIDVWSAGTVMAEMLLGQPIFPGYSGVDQLVEIIKALGTPTRDQILSMNPVYENKRNEYIDELIQKEVLLDQKLDGVIERLGDAYNLVSMVLEYDPSARPSVIEICKNNFFMEIFEIQELPNGQVLPPLDKDILKY